MFFHNGSAAAAYTPLRSFRCIPVIVVAICISETQHKAVDRSQNMSGESENARVISAVGSNINEARPQSSYWCVSLRAGFVGTHLAVWHCCNMPSSNEAKQQLRERLNGTISGSNAGHTTA